MAREQKVPAMQGYTEGEIKAILAPLVGLDDPAELEGAVIFAYSGEELRVAMGVPSDDEYRAVLRRLVHELVDMLV